MKKTNAGLRWTLAMLVVIALCGFSVPLTQAQTATESVAAEDSSRDVRLTFVEGEVILYEQGQGEEGVPAQEGIPLNPGDRVRTGAESRAEIGLDGESAIELGSNSEFVVESSEKSESVFSLNAGSLLAKIRSLLAKEQMKFKAPTAVAAVRGTEFAVEVEKEGPSHVAVFDEGSIEVRGNDGWEGTLLAANQETSVARGERPSAARPLERFAHRRIQVERLRSRIGVMRRHWRRMSPSQRGALRKKMFERRRRLIETIRQRRRHLKQEGKQLPPGRRLERRRSRPGRDHRP